MALSEGGPGSLRRRVGRRVTARSSRIGLGVRQVLSLKLGIRRGVRLGIRLGMRLGLRQGIRQEVCWLEERYSKDHGMRLSMRLGIRLGVRSSASS